MTIKILIIDDDQYTREVLGKILLRDKLTAHLKPEIINAADGVAGVAQFMEHRPQLAIIDLFMPKMDGFAVCKELRDVASPAELTIAVTSGIYKDPSIAASLESDFAAHFFAKPYQLKHIAAFVAETFATAQPGRPKRESSTGAIPTAGAFRPNQTAARLFWDLMEKEATGRLILRRGQVVRQIELFVGHPVQVTTNVREETLGNFLVMRGRTDKATQRTAMALAASSNKRLGEAFIEMGVLTPQTLIEELTAQTRHKLSNALRWADGDWTFRPGEPRNSHSNALDFAEVIVSGLASGTRVQSPDPAIAELSQKPLTLNARGEALLRQISTSVSGDFAKHFQPGVTMEELRSAGVTRAHLFRGLDVLSACAGLEVGSTNAIPKQVSDEPSEALNLKDLAASRSSSTPQAELYSGLFDSETPLFTRTASNPLEKLGSEQLWEDPAAIDPSQSSGLIEIADIIEDAAEANTATSEASLDQDFGEDSVVNVSFSSIGPDESGLERRQELLQEFLRIHEKSLYEVLNVGAEASADEIIAAYDERTRLFSKDKYTAEELGRDYGKLNVVVAAYRQARETLLDDNERQRYNDGLYSSTLDLPNAPSMGADIAFQESEQLLAAGNTTEAVEKLREAIAISPGEPAYHATLGWALFIEGGQDEHAADAARAHINEALAMAPDSGLAHEYKGLVHAKLGDDPEAALQHLAKALEADPTRHHALAAIEALYLARAEYRELDRLYRRLLFHLGQNAKAEGAVIWRRMGDLHRHYLRSPDQALVAYREALKRSPDDTELTAICHELSAGGLDAFFEANDGLVAAWLGNPADFSPIHELLELADSGGNYDAKFLASSALVSAEVADASELETYQRFRPRFLLRAQGVIGQKAWEQLLHRQDHALVGALYALLGDTIADLRPLTGAIEEAAQADELPESSLSPEFRATRAYVAAELGIPEPTIYSRADYGHEIHAAALKTPILLAGYEAVTCTDKLELAFRLGRAMSFLRPGRAVAAGCPSRVLKSAMMACYSLGAPGARVPDADGSIREFREAIEKLDSAVQYQALELVAHISQEHPTLNLSRWTRSLARTANQCGLLLCGDSRAEHALPRGTAGQRSGHRTHGLWLVLETPSLAGRSGP